MVGGKVYARVEAMQVRDVKGEHYRLGEPVRTDLAKWTWCCSARIRLST